MCGRMYCGQDPGIQGGLTTAAQQLNPFRHTCGRDGNANFNLGARIS